MKAAFAVSPTLGEGGAQLFRLALPVDVASMPGTAAVAKTVSLKLTPTDAKPPVLLTLYRFRFLRHRVERIQAASFISSCRRRA